MSKVSRGLRSIGPALLVPLRAALFLLGVPVITPDNRTHGEGRRHTAARERGTLTGEEHRCGQDDLQRGDAC